MGQLSLSIPVVGQPFAGEAVKADNNFTLIQGVINGNIDPTNLTPTGGVMHLATRTMVANASASIGDLVIASPSVTVTLPAPAANALVAVVALQTVTGATPVTVTGAASSIVLPGFAAGVTSFSLGTPGSAAVLQSDGTKWYSLAGTHDTGWITMTRATNVGAFAGAYTPAYRTTGDKVFLRGGLQNNTGGNIVGGVAWATGLPSPAATIFSAYGLSVSTGGALSYSQTLANGSLLGIDSYWYPLT